MDKQVSILLAEDNILNQRIISFSLRKYNYKVEIANNGKEAVDQFQNKTFDVILMDIMMPVMDGCQATREIRKFEKENGIVQSTPIIAVTANTIEFNYDKCISYGMNEFMEKPFNIDKLNSIFTQMKIVNALKSA